MVTKGESGYKLGVWDYQIWTTMYKINNKSYGIAQGTIFGIL